MRYAATIGIDVLSEKIAQQTQELGELYERLNERDRELAVTKAELEDLRAKPKRNGHKKEPGELAEVK